MTRRHDRPLYQNTVPTPRPTPSYESPHLPTPLSPFSYTSPSPSHTPAPSRFYLPPSRPRTDRVRRKRSIRSATPRSPNPLVKHILPRHTGDEYGFPGGAADLKLDDVEDQEESKKKTCRIWSGGLAAMVTSSSACASPDRFGGSSAGEDDAPDIEFVTPSHIRFPSLPPSCLPSSATDTRDCFAALDWTREDIDLEIDDAHGDQSAPDSLEGSPADSPCPLPRKARPAAPLRYRCSVPRPSASSSPSSGAGDATLTRILRKADPAQTHGTKCPRPAADPYAERSKTVGSTHSSSPVRGDVLSSSPHSTHLRDSDDDCAQSPGFTPTPTSFDGRDLDRSIPSLRRSNSCSDAGETSFASQQSLNLQTPRSDWAPSSPCVTKRSPRKKPSRIVASPTFSSWTPTTSARPPLPPPSSGLQVRSTHDSTNETNLDNGFASDPCLSAGFHPARYLSSAGGLINLALQLRDLAKARDIDGASFSINLTKRRVRGPPKKGRRMNAVSKLPGKHRDSSDLAEARLFRNIMRSVGKSACKSIFPAL